MNRRSVLAMLGLTLIAPACMPADMEDMPGPGRPPVSLRPGVLSGTVTYRERIALPADAVIEVSIVDVARQDVAARTIARINIPTRGRQVPIPFVLRYPGDRPRQHAEYAVQARITHRGDLLFISDTRNTLRPNGRMNLVLVSARR